MQNTRLSALSLPLTPQGYFISAVQGVPKQLSISYLCIKVEQHNQLFLGIQTYGSSESFL